MTAPIKIYEVGPRDGLQNEKTFVPTQLKHQFIARLLKAGFKRLEITSFVSPSAIPQLKDATELVRLLMNDRELDAYVADPHITRSALVPNQKGWHRLETALDFFNEIGIFTAASETFNQKNIRARIDDSLRRFQAFVPDALKQKMRVRAYISTALVCPYEGNIDPKRVLPIVEKLLDMGCYQISIGDTIGRASPIQVEKLWELLLKHYPSETFAGHFHDTFNLALTNVYVSYQMGIRTFDSSVGGLGGCPYAKGASGNLASEDLQFLADTMNWGTDVNIAEIIDMGRFLEAKLNITPNSKTFRALSG